MDPTQSQIHARRRIAELTSEAAEERLLKLRRRSRATRPAFSRQHLASIRSALGRWLIGVGSAMGGECTDQGARRPA